MNGFDRVAAVVLTSALGLLGACREEAPPEVEVVRPVKILEIGGPDAGVTREYAGEIRAAQHAEMAFEVQGKITDFLVKEGESVRLGQMLARLDARDYQASLDADLAQLGQARTELERAKILFDEGVGPKVDVERRQRTVEVIESRVVQSRKAVEDAVLVAPFDGVVARKLVEDFQNVQAKEPVLILQDDSTLRIKVNVPERDIAGGRRTEDSAAQISARIRPRVLVSALPDQEFPAQLVELATTADPATRTFEATFEFERPEAAVLPGMTAKVRLTGRRGAGGDGVAVPANAVVSDAGGDAFVWVVDPATMTVSRRRVEMGELTGADVEIRSGVEPGDWVAISGVQQLRDGNPVRRYEP